MYNVQCTPCVRWTTNESAVATKKRRRNSNNDHHLRLNFHRGVMTGLTLDGLVRLLWSFLRGFADSLKGAVDLFFLDSRAVKLKEKRSLQRDVKKEQLLSRESPMREIESFAKKRAIERRQNQQQQQQQQHPQQQQQQVDEQPRILERTLKCCALNGCVFWFSIVLFENFLLPLIKAVLFTLFPGSDLAWNYTQPILSVTFSTLWVLPFFLLSKIVNAIWFQDIADSAFRTSRNRPRMMSSVSVMIADTVFSLVVESIFLVQGKLCSFLPIELVGQTVNLVHLCLLNSLYCFEYKWFSQGLELHRRLAYIEQNWPYFLGFGMPLAILTSMPDSLIVSGCVFSILFPLFIVSGNQAQVVMSDQDITVNIFHPTIFISNWIFSKTFKKKQQNPAQQQQQQQPQDRRRVQFK